eukprot:SAG11_NODE_30295_length_302_cov_0.768473_1_plen_57_part_01
MASGKVAGAAARGGAMSDEAMRSLFIALDVNDDGLISMAEFVEACVRRLSAFLILCA